MKKKIFLSVFILYTLILTTATLAPAAILAMAKFTIWDKLIHALSFGTWAALLYGYNHFFTEIETKKNILNSILLATLYGILIEYLQYFLPLNRSFEYLDMLADLIGAIVFTVVTHYVIKTLKSALFSN